MNRVWNIHQNPFGTSAVHPLELQAAILGHPVVFVTHHHSHVWNSFSVVSTSVPSNRFGIQPRTMIFRTKKNPPTLAQIHLANALASAALHDVFPSSTDGCASSATMRMDKGQRRVLSFPVTSHGRQKCQRDSIFS